MGKSKTWKKPDKSILGRIKEEMAMPRVAKSALDKVMKTAGRAGSLGSRKSGRSPKME